MDTWTDRLSEYVDGTLSGSERAALEAHLAGCAACTTTLDELRRVVARARGLEDRPPAADLWPGIAERIGVSPDVVPLSARRRARRLSFSVPQLIAASIALALVGGAAVRLALPRGRAALTLEGSRPGAATVVSWAGPAISASDSAVLELRAALDLGRRSGQIDTATVRVLEQSLMTIDSAVTQARRALDTDPNSVYLHQHLAETLRRKSQFLRRATTLVSART